MGASAVRARAIDCAVVKAYSYGRERARTAESTALPGAHGTKASSRVFGRLAASRSTSGAAPAAPLPRSLKTPSVEPQRLSALSKKWRLDVQAQKRVKFVTLSLNANTANAASIMSDQASLLATIAGLQEQIDSMNGQLTEVRPFFICSCPFLRARCGRGGPPRPAAPTAAPAPPPPHHRRRGNTPSPARPGPRGRARDHKSKTTPAAAPPPRHAYAVCLPRGQLYQVRI